MLLVLPNNVVRKMRCHMLLAGRREIGGILMGEEIGYQHFRVVDFTVDADSGTQADFFRNSSHHYQALDNFFKITGSDYSRFNYLGEWHTHPSFTLHPSTQDVRSMQNLVDGTGGVDFAVLFISRLKRIFWFECSAYLFVLKQIPIVVEVVFEDKHETIRKSQRDV